jgi:hypothetical protein
MSSYILPTVPRGKVLTLSEDPQFTNLRLCATNRSKADMKLILEPLTSRSLSLHDEHGQKEDIETYIKSRQQKQELAKMETRA